MSLCQIALYKKLIIINDYNHIALGKTFVTDAAHFIPFECPIQYSQCHVLQVL